MNTQLSRRIAITTTILSGLFAAALAMAAPTHSAAALAEPAHGRAAVRSAGGEQHATAESKPMAAAPKKQAHKLVDLNVAAREELVALPGIGEAIADKIIAARPFKAKSELLSKGLVTKAQYSKLAPHVIAKQSK